MENRNYLEQYFVDHKERENHDDCNWFFGSRGIHLHDSFRARQVSVVGRGDSVVRG